MADPIALPASRGDNPRDTRVALDRLHTRLTELQNALEAMQRQVASQPRILTLDEINQALSSTGSHPLNLTGLQGQDIGS